MTLSPVALGAGMPGLVEQGVQIGHGSIMDPSRVAVVLTAPGAYANADNPSSGAALGPSPPRVEVAVRSPERGNAEICHICRWADAARRIVEGAILGLCDAKSNKVSNLDEHRR
jgi:hypothetical protein